MRRALPKTIHGTSVTQQEFLNTLVEALSAMGGGGVGDLIPTLGPEWETREGKQRLAQTLCNLVKRGTLRNLDGQRGVYEVTVYGKRAGVSVFDRQEKDILDVIRSHGGFCHLRDILEAFGVRPVGPDRQDIQNDTLYTRLQQVIRRSTVIRQDHIERGVYNLPWDQTHALPLRGEWAAMLIKHGWAMARGAGNEQDNVEDWRGERDAFFQVVGCAFKALREARGLSAEEFAEEVSIRPVLYELIKRAPKEIANITGDWTARTEAQRLGMIEAGATDAEVFDFVTEDSAQMEPSLPRCIYSRFEKGIVGAHFHAPLSLYVKIADFFNVCPASLSRGLIAPIPDSERLRPAHTNYLL